MNLRLHWFFFFFFFFFLIREVRSRIGKLPRRLHEVKLSSLHIYDEDSLYKAHMKFRLN